MKTLQDKTMRVRIECPDGLSANTKVTDAQTGEELLHLYEVNVHIPAQGVATAELKTYLPYAVIVAEGTITEETPAQRHQRQRDAVYVERDKCVSLIARMAQKLGYPAGIKRDPDAEFGWGYIIYVDLPNGQVSWHIADSELPYFSFLGKYEGEWDLHSTEQKYARVLDPGV